MCVSVGAYVEVWGVSKCGRICSGVCECVSVGMYAEVLVLVCYCGMWNYVKYVEFCGCMWKHM